MKNRKERILKLILDSLPAILTALATLVTAIAAVLEKLS